MAAARKKPQKTKQGPSEEDVYIGIRLKVRRVLLGWSQEKLADALGMTFQQIQKYEKGLNRISSGTLYRASKILDVPYDYFVKGIEEHLLKTFIGFSDNEQEPIEGAPPSKLEDFMSEKEIIRLIHKYRKIAHNPGHVKLINEMLDMLAKHSEDNE